jgi:hypothetical protein
LVSALPRRLQADDARSSELAFLRRGGSGSDLYPDPAAGHSHGPDHDRGSHAAKVNLDLPHPPAFLASEKFAWNGIKIRPKVPADLGYLRVQASVDIEGEIKQQGGVLKTSLKRDAIKLAIEQSTFEDTKASFGVKIDEKSLKPVADAVANGSKQDLIKALLKPFEASIKSTYRWGKFSLTPEEGLEFSTTSSTPRWKRYWGCSLPRQTWRDLSRIAPIASDREVAVHIPACVGASPPTWHLSSAARLHPGATARTAPMFGLSRHVAFARTAQNTGTTRCRISCRVRQPMMNDAACITLIFAYPRRV